MTPDIMMTPAHALPKKQNNPWASSLTIEAYLAVAVVVFHAIAGVGLVSKAQAPR